MRREIESCPSRDPTCPCKNRRDPMTLTETRKKAPCKTTTSTTSTTTTTTVTSTKSTASASATATAAATTVTAITTTQPAAAPRATAAATMPMTSNLSKPYETDPNTTSSGNANITPASTAGASEITDGAPSNDSNVSSGMNAGGIAAVFMGVVGLVGLVAAIFLWRSRGENNHQVPSPPPAAAARFNQMFGGVAEGKRPSGAFVASTLDMKEARRSNQNNSNYSTPNIPTAAELKARAFDGSAASNSNPPVPHGLRSNANKKQVVRTPNPLYEPARNNVYDTNATSSA